MRNPDDVATEVIPRVTLASDPPTVTFPAITVPTACPPSPLARLVDPSFADPSPWAPPQRWWRRPICWLVLGHFWHPGSDGCLECGKVRSSSRG